MGGPHHGTLRNILEPPVQYRKTLNFFGNPKNTFPYMNLNLRTIPELLVMSRIPSETPNKLWYHHHEYLITTLASTNVKCVTLRVREYVDMIETPLRSIINSRTMDVHNDSHIFNEDLYRFEPPCRIFHSLCLAIFYLPEIRSSVSLYLVQSRYRQVLFTRSIIQYPHDQTH